MMFVYFCKRMTYISDIKGTNGVTINNSFEVKKGASLVIQTY